MKKKLIIGVCILLVVILLIPIPMRLKDGGTVAYTLLRGRLRASGTLRQL